MKVKSGVDLNNYEDDIREAAENCHVQVIAIEG